MALCKVGGLCKRVAEGRESVDSESNTMLSRGSSRAKQLAGWGMGHHPTQLEGFALQMSGDICLI